MYLPPEESWLQIDRESNKAYLAFSVYRDLGPDRSMCKAWISQLPPYRCDKNGRRRPSRLLSGCWVGWSRKFEWYRRAAAFDFSMGLSRTPVAMVRLMRQYLARAPLSRRRRRVLSLD